ncbi:MAG: hypothetical protein HZA34_03225 [Candidatus Pacebacteria bacterium]|nr:hypothetical protein [Candidatus Paceibacterota bacterium]
MVSFDSVNKFIDAAVSIVPGAETPQQHLDKKRNLLNRNIQALTALVKNGNRELPTRNFNAKTANEFINAFTTVIHHIAATMDGVGDGDRARLPTIPRELVTDTLDLMNLIEKNASDLSMTVDTGRIAWIRQTLNGLNVVRREPIVWANEVARGDEVGTIARTLDTVVGTMLGSGVENASSTQLAQIIQTMATRLREIREHQVEQERRGGEVQRLDTQIQQRTLSLCGAIWQRALLVGLRDASAAEDLGFIERVLTNKDIFVGDTTPSIVRESGGNREVLEKEKQILAKFREILTKATQGRVQILSAERLRGLNSYVNSTIAELIEVHKNPDCVGISSDDAKALGSLCQWMDARARVLEGQDKKLDLTSILSTAKRIPAQLGDRIHIEGDFRGGSSSLEGLLEVIQMEPLEGLDSHGLTSLVNDLHHVVFDLIDAQKNKQRRPVSLADAKLLHRSLISLNERVENLSKETQGSRGKKILEEAQNQIKQTLSSIGTSLKIEEVLDIAVNEVPAATQLEGLVAKIKNLSRQGDLDVGDVSENIILLDLALGNLLRERQRNDEKIPYNTSDLTLVSAILEKRMKELQLPPHSHNLSSLTNRMNSIHQRIEQLRSRWEDLTSVSLDDTPMAHLLDLLGGNPPDAVSGYGERQVTNLTAQLNAIIYELIAQKKRGENTLLTAQDIEDLRSLLDVIRRVCEGVSAGVGQEHAMDVTMNLIRQISGYLDDGTLGIGGGNIRRPQQAAPLPSQPSSSGEWWTRKQ